MARRESKYIDGVKVCLHCGKTEQFTKFYPGAVLCYTCCNAEQFERKRHCEEFQAKKRASRAKYKAKHPELNAIYMKVSRKIARGKLVKPSSCQRCGISGKRLHGHHEDYSKPLKVVWLCPKCHTTVHEEAKNG